MSRRTHRLAAAGRPLHWQLQYTDQDHIYTTGYYIKELNRTINAIQLTIHAVVIQYKKPNTSSIEVLHTQIFLFKHEGLFHKQNLRT